MTENQKTNVTIVTGFLGAGKTTFINGILECFPNLQFALVENEFGEISVDTKLIKGVDASQMFELKQGCICCSINDEYELVLLELAERFPNVQHLLIETTGIADPIPVIQPFFKNNDLKEIYHLNGTICLIDAQNFNTHPEKDVALNQLVVADLVMISKVENHSEAEKENLQKDIKGINPYAGCRFTQSGTKYRDEGCINDLFLRKKKPFSVPDEPLNFNVAEKKSGRSILFNPGGGGNFHSHIQSKILRFETPVNKTEFLRWLSYTLDIYKSQIYRTKGILTFEDELFEYILQGVGGDFELEQGDFILSETESVLVLIGINLDQADLKF